MDNDLFAALGYSSLVNGLDHKIMLASVRSLKRSMRFQNETLTREQSDRFAREVLQIEPEYEPLLWEYLSDGH